MSGPSSVSSQPGTFVSIPGAGVGTTDADESEPALPNDAAPSSPGLCRSISVIRAPCCCRYVAAQAPMTPAPMMTTCGEPPATSGMVMLPRSHPALVLAR